MTGSIWLLWLLDYNLSIAVWVGIIALAGLAAQTGTVMIIYLEEAFHAYRRAGRMKTQHDLFEAITYGAVQRVRPKLMTVATTILGLFPALWATGAGAEAISRIAAPMIGGLITSTILTLEIVPAIYSIWRGRQVEWVKGPRPPKKSWNELSHAFAEMERREHGEILHSPPAVESTERTNGTRWVLWIGLGALLAAVIGFVLLKKPSGPAPESGVNAVTNSAASTSLPQIELTADQRRSLDGLLKAASAVSAGLASDSVQQFNAAAPVLTTALNDAVSTFPLDHPWSPLLLRAAEHRLTKTGDLTEARAQFLPFSTAFVDLVTVVRQQDPASARVKLYRCPMAPKPGLWMQLQEPLRNPYFGSEMLDCGEEIAP
jgi:hypothetical protein